MHSPRCHELHSARTTCRRASDGPARRCALMQQERGARGTRQVPGPRPPPPILRFLKYQPGR
eukprot:7722885-Alexandrium_andersonii.AAC.1